MEPDGDSFKLSTGRVFYANFAILGLGPAMDDGRLRITYGCDGGVCEDEPDYLTASPTRSDGFTQAEREEIAAYMIDLWKRWATQGA